MSALSVSSTSSTVGSVRRIAVSSGRVSRNSSENTSVFVWSQSPGAGLDPQDLLGVVPLVEGAGLVDALVALQPHQTRAGGLRDRPGQLGLADPGGALHQQRLAQPVGEEDRGGRCGIGQVAGLGQPPRDIVDVSEQRCRACGDAHGFSPVRPGGCGRLPTRSTWLRSILAGPSVRGRAASGWRCRSRRRNRTARRR